MMKFSLREFANIPEEMMLRWRGYRCPVTVVDDEGESVESDTYVLMLTWLGLIIHRHYNHIPYSVKELIPSNKVAGNTAKMITYDDDVQAIPINYMLAKLLPTIKSLAEIDDIKRMIHIWQNKLHNQSVVMGEGSSLSASAESVGDLMADEGVMEIRDQILNKEISIDEGEDKFNLHIKAAESLDRNVMAMLARTGGVSVNQAYQLSVMRGGVFSLNNTIHPNAVSVPYAHGITNLADSLGEKNASGKALTNNGKALKDSELFHRKTHILTAVVRGMNFGWDCGTRICVPIKIASMNVAMGLRGKWQQMPAGNLQLIDNDNVWDIKVGETIWIRSVAFCNSRDAGVPCGTCYGMMATSVPFNQMMDKIANVGMWSATSICNPMGQGMLSTKHFIRNAITRQFVPHKRDTNIISSNGDEIFLNPEVIEPGCDMILGAEIVNVLSDIRSLGDLNAVSLEKLPYFAEVTFRYAVEDIMMGGKTIQQHAAHTSVSSRKARFSLEFLRYVLDHGWETLGKKHIRIDLTHWNVMEPVFSLPFIREDLDAHRARVESFITFSKRNSTWKNQVVTPKVFGEVLTEYWTLIAQEIKGINIVHPEIMLYCCLTATPGGIDASIPTGDVPKYFSSFEEAVIGRGIGHLMIYERQQNVLNKMKTFRMVNRQGSPLEAFFSLGVG